MSLKICAVHINYANRDESNDEQYFVEEWCKSMNIVCVSRRIHEINRPKCMKLGLRELYESYTKKVRFGTYRLAMTEILQDRKSPVILGHNKDDAFENILTNIKAESKYENLCGFQFMMQGDFGIEQVRPLHCISKEDIFTLAHYYGIPYLKDTTVTWSVRYKIRNQVKPVLEDKIACYNQFFSLAKYCKDMSNILSILVSAVLEDIKLHGGVCVPSNHPLCCNYVFIKEFYNKLFGCHFSHKSLQNYVDRMIHMKVHLHGEGQKVVLNKMHSVYVSRNTPDSITISLL
jgi:tRNA(Ile)-lysidine synthase TilS/MesJ